MSKCYLVIDCGTTNLRVKLLDENKQLVDAVKAEGGVRHTSIDGHNGRLRKYYRITEAGRARLGAFAEEWKEMMRIYQFVTREEATP